MARWYILGVGVALWASVGGHTFAEEPRLSGDWGGRRSSLASRGLDVELRLTLEGFFGKRRGAEGDIGVLGLAEAAVQLDTEKAGGWRNGTFRLHLHGIRGDRVSEAVLDLQGTSNVDAPDAARIYEGWYEHRWRDGRTAVLFGLHDVSSDFDAVESARLLLNASFGIQPEISQVQPSTYPLTALGARVRTRLRAHGYLMVGIYDGSPGDPDEPVANQVKIGPGEGSFQILESGWRRSGGAGVTKVAGGVWSHDVDFTDFAGRPWSRNHGAYLIAETSWAQGSSALEGFVQLGQARADRNRIHRYVGAGLVRRGLGPRRKDDRVAVGVARVTHSRAFLDTSPGFHRHETTVEATYHAQLRPGIAVQPDLQLVLRPGLDPSARRAVSFLLRLVLDF